MIELIVVLSFILHNWADLWVALSLLVVNAVLSFLQEQRASAAVSALRHRLQVTHAFSVTEPGRRSPHRIS
jgi:H+-transporting ATPase